MKKIAILGSTGSIGVQALNIVAASQGRIQVLGLAAGQNTELLIEQIKKFNPEAVSVQNEAAVHKIQKLFPGLKVYFGQAGLVKIATLEKTEMVLVSVVGVAALIPALEAVKLGKDIALASKEILVAAGQIFTEAVKKYRVKLLPVDSEHSAIMQSFPPVENNGCFEYPVANLQKLILTASGGAFRNLTKFELKDKKIVDALKHPNWSMGKKITVDSATLMNKGLEVIEAHWLFGVPYNQIEVVIHPQSIIHSLAEFVDGSLIAQLGLPDMRLPIQYAFYYPQRIVSNWPKLKLTEIKELTFQEPDLTSFKALSLAYQAGQSGGTLPAVLNAANEAAVELFSQGQIGFLDIADLVEETLGLHECITNPQLEEIIACDDWARKKVLALAKVKV